MVDAPEKIWAASVTENYGEWQTTTDGLPRPTEYVRADLHEQVKRERDDAKQALRNEIVAHGNTIRGKAERLAGARVVTDAMVKAFQEKYREFWKGSWPDTETSRELLRAALAAPAGEAEPSKWTVPGSSYAGATTPPDASAIRGAQVEAVVQAVRPYTRETLFIDEHRDLVRAALAGAKP